MGHPEVPRARGGRRGPPHCRTAIEGKEGSVPQTDGSIEDLESPVREREDPWKPRPQSQCEERLSGRALTWILPGAYLPTTYIYLGSQVPYVDTVIRDPRPLYASIH